MRALDHSIELANRNRVAQALLPLKLAPPPLREGVLLRPDLQALLAEVRLQPLTLVTAGRIWQNNAARAVGAGVGSHWRAGFVVDA